jgi:hypothetical protein
VNETDWIRLPGLFKRWEAELLEHDHGDEYRVEPAGEKDGVALFAIYVRPLKAAKETQQ